MELRRLRQSDLEAVMERRRLETLGWITLGALLGAGAVLLFVRGRGARLIDEEPGRFGEGYVDELPSGPHKLEPRVGR